VLLKVVEPERGGRQVVMSIWWTSWMGTRTSAPPMARDMPRRSRQLICIGV